MARLRVKKMHTEFGKEDLKENYHLQVPGIEWITLIMILLY